jgi:succinyl-diaminopimelate desuccinylase
MWRLSKDLNLSFNPHPYYPQGPTVTPGVMVEGGVYLGIHPGYAEFTSDIRLLPGMSPDQVTADLTEFFDGLQSEDEEFRYQLETLGSSTQGTLIGDEPFVQQLKSAAEQVLGREVRFGGFPAYCDAYWFHKVAGIPTVAGFGPGLLPLAHGPNEYVSVTAIHQASKIYALAALGYLS